MEVKLHRLKLEAPHSVCPTAECLSIFSHKFLSNMGLLNFSALLGEVLQASDGIQEKSFCLEFHKTENLQDVLSNFWLNIFTDYVGSSVCTLGGGAELMGGDVEVSCGCVLYRGRYC